MDPEGKYIYCIIPSNQERNFGPLGVGGRGDDVLTIGYDDLTMVVSNHPLSKLTVNRDNLLAHEKVIEEVMKEFGSVLPVRFGTIAANADEIRNLLDRRYREFSGLLRDMDHLVELGVKGVWTNMGAIFKEIEEESPEIRKAKEKIRSSDAANDIQARAAVGRMVKDALQRKKEEESERIVNVLRRCAYEHKANGTPADEHFLNAAFLVGRGRENEFDNIMDELSDEYKDRVKFIYAGPLPVFNFANITIYPEEWEK